MKQPGWDENRRIRFFGDHGAPVIVLHGGPGAFGGSVRMAQVEATPISPVISSDPGKPWVKAHRPG